MVKTDDFEYVCPLCCEEFDISDREFYPCKCGYQVCMWCWHRIRESETGLCPACRTPYGEDPHQFSAVDVEEVLRVNKEKEAAAKREKHQQQSGNEQSQSGGSDPSSGLAMEVPKDRSQLANMRVIRRNLIYAVGLPPSVATEEILRKPEYFGQYGKIAKIVINRTNATPASAAEARRASASAYVTFQHKEDTLACILALDGFYLENRNIRASYGTSKYCSAFIKNVRCNNPECTYLHEMGAAEDTFTKQEIQAGYVTSGRDVLARQQQILAEQLRLQQLAAGGSGNAAQALPRKRVGGGGPSGTGKAAAHPMFPPPEYDEPAKPIPPPVPAAAGIAKVSTTTTAAAASLNAATISAKMGRSTSVATAPRTLQASSNVAAVASTGSANPPRKASTGGLSTTTTAASIVASGRKESNDMHNPNSTLTALTPLKRSAITKVSSAGAGSTKASSVPRSTSSSPANSTTADEKMPAVSMLRNGKKQEDAQNSCGVTDSIVPHAASSSLAEPFGETPLGIGGEVIRAQNVGAPSAVVGLGQLDVSMDTHLDEPLPGIHTSSTGLGSLGGLPIEMPGAWDGGKPSSLSIALGGDVFNGPLSHDNHQKSAVGSGNDKWNAGSGVGGSPLTHMGDNNSNGPNFGGSRMDGGNPLWSGGTAAPGNSGVIGGQRLGVGNAVGSNSTSALASILGINLPTGSGSLQETTSLWSSVSQPPPGPSPISALNSSSINPHYNPLNMMAMGGSSQLNTQVSNNNGSSLIGGVPIGAGLSGGYHGPGVIGAGNNKSDIALLQSLLPGVHITTDSNNPMMGFSYNNTGGWGLAPGLAQHGLGSGSGGIGGDPIHPSGNWVGSGMSLQGHHGSSVGPVGQHNSPQNQRQQGPGIW